MQKTMTCEPTTDLYYLSKILSLGMDCLGYLPFLVEFFTCLALCLTHIKVELGT